MPSAVKFSGVLILYAKVSEHSVPFSYAGRYEE